MRLAAPTSGTTPRVDPQKNSFQKALRKHGELGAASWAFDQPKVKIDYWLNFIIVALSLAQWKWLGCFSFSLTAGCSEKHAAYKDKRIEFDNNRLIRQYTSTPALTLRKPAFSSGP